MDSKFVHENDNIIEFLWVSYIFQDRH